jgi:phosphate transport system protein
LADRRIHFGLLMSKHLQRGLDDLREELLALFGVVEQMIDMAVRSLVERRPDLAGRVIVSDSTVDSREVRLEEECLKMLALHQPVATDLRQVISVVKINSELERMADLACNIAERAIALDMYPLFTVPDELNDMARESISMVKRALDAFVREDAEKAREVIRDDDVVDALNRMIIDQLQELMQESPEYIIPAVHCFSASRNIECVADLATSLAEDVVYLIEGEIVRHAHTSTAKKPISGN